MRRAVAEQQVKAPDHAFVGGYEIDPSQCTTCQVCARHVDEHGTRSERRARRAMPTVRPAEDAREEDDDRDDVTDPAPSWDAEERAAARQDREDRDNWNRRGK